MTTQKYIPLTSQQRESALVIYTLIQKSFRKTPSWMEVIIKMGELKREERLDEEQEMILRKFCVESMQEQEKKISNLEVPCNFCGTPNMENPKKRCSRTWICTNPPLSEE